MRTHFWRITNIFHFILLVCIGLLLLILLAITLLDVLGKGEYVNDEIAEGILFFVCIPGFLIGIIGSVITANRKK